MEGYGKGGKALREGAGLAKSFLITFRPVGAVPPALWETVLHGLKGRVLKIRGAKRINGVGELRKGIG